MDIKKNEIIRIMALAWNVDINNIPYNAEFNSYPYWDSMGHVSLLTSLEQEYNIELNYDVLVELVSIDKIVNYLNMIRK